MIDDTALYVWGAYGLGVALVLTELVLLHLRGKAIRGHLGWIRGHPRGPAAPDAGVDRSRQSGVT